MTHIFSHVNIYNLLFEALDTTISRSLRWQKYKNLIARCVVMIRRFCEQLMIYKENILEIYVGIFISFLEEVYFSNFGIAKCGVS